MLRGVDACRFGLWMGSLGILTAVCLLVHALVASDYSPNARDIYFNIVFWGAGHAMQHANAVFMAVCWVMLAPLPPKVTPLSRQDVFWVFAWLGVPFLLMPLLTVYGPGADAYRTGFTRLMQWGIAPPLLWLLWLLRRRYGGARRSAGRENTSSRTVRIALRFSIALFLVGICFGAGIRGPDLRIPGHYHATIGAITIAFMAVSMRLLTGGPETRHAKTWKWFARTMPLYGMGQLLFAGGLFIAGYFGLARKTYGAELGFEHIGQTVGIVLAGIGGLAAFAGGACYAFGVIAALRGR